VNLNERAEQLMLHVPALWYALRDRRTPLAARLLAGLTVAYALSPVDLIPDFIPVLGYLDDLLIVPVLAALTIRLIPAGVLAEAREQARARWDEDSARRWYFILPVLFVWLAILGLIAWRLVRAVQH